MLLRPGRLIMKAMEASGKREQRTRKVECKLLPAALAAETWNQDTKDNARYHDKHDTNDDWNRDPGSCFDCHFGVRLCCC